MKVCFICALILQMIEASRNKHFIYMCCPLSEFHAIQFVFVVVVLDINQAHIVP